MRTHHTVFCETFFLFLNNKYTQNLSRFRSRAFRVHLIFCISSPKKCWPLKAIYFCHTQKLDFIMPLMCGCLVFVFVFCFALSVNAIFRLPIVVGQPGDKCVDGRKRERERKLLQDISSGTVVSPNSTAIKIDFLFETFRTENRDSTRLFDASYKNDSLRYKNKDIERNCEINKQKQRKKECPSSSHTKISLKHRNRNKMTEHIQPTKNIEEKREKKTLFT